MARPYFNTNITTYGFWGWLDPPVFSANHDVDRVWKGALARGDVKGLKLLRGAKDGDEYQRNGRTPVVILDYKVAFEATPNTKAKWISLAGNSTTYFDEFSNLFAPGNGSTSGLMYSRTAASDATLYYSDIANGGFNIGVNQAFTYRVFLLKPPGNGHPLHQIRWHSGTSAFQAWQFQVKDGKAAMMRLTNAWTQTQETQLHTLLDQATISDADQTTINNLKKTLYIDYDDCNDLDIDADDWYGRIHTLTFVPEPGGLANVVTEGGKTATFKNSDRLEARTQGIMWGPGSLTIWNSGGMYAWQVGKPVFAANGQLRFGKIKSGYFNSALGNLIYNGQFDSLAMTAGSGPVPPSFTSDTTLLGTNIDVSDEVINSVEFERVVTLSTTDTNFTPFFYAIYAFIEAGTLTRNTDLAQSIIPSQVLDLQPEFDSEQARRQFRVVVLDKRGAAVGVLASGHSNFNYPMLENRMATLTLHGTAQITQGIITKSERKWMKTVTPNTIPDNVANWYTELHLTIADQWAVLDQDVMVDDPVGDGMYLSHYVRRILLGAGISPNRLNNIPPKSAFVNNGIGRILPSAALGEPPCIRPQSGTTKRGEFLRELLDRWGNGLTLYIDDSTGNWYLGTFPTTIISSYVSTGSAINQSSARLGILSPLDWIRDPDGFYNHIRVEGAEHPKKGTRLVGEWHDWASIKQINSARYIGRVKSLPIVRDDSIRTLSDLAWVRRSLVRRYGLAGRFFQFTTFYNQFLCPRRRITLDGTVAQIVRIPSASIADDRMTLVCREVT